MVLRLLEENTPPDAVVFFDTQMEFPAVYAAVDRMEALCLREGIGFTRVRDPEPVWLTMLAKPVRSGHYGYEWCGGPCRWGTAKKRNLIRKAIGPDAIEYVGIAADERERVKDDPGKLYPLVDWGMTERDCLIYCRERGWTWEQDGVDLYDILSRVSCWCCGNKNLKELEAMYRRLPKWWGYLEGLQSRIDRPFRRDGRTVFDLRESFEKRSGQMELF